ncbi:MAG: hypothetical protein KME55_01625 [Nostoc indistinguendum CM1-VF10]|jgi:hypothetical protein|nr:hypothetical protein [Nostoc indistinguendum CM1-VF10]
MNYVSVATLRTPANKQVTPSVLQRASLRIILTVLVLLQDKNKRHEPQATTTANN